MFRLVNARLREARDKSPSARVRAICDNRRLWTVVMDLVKDPANGLPEGTRAALVSVAISVKRVMDAGDPDFDWLVSINDAIAAGLGLAS